MVRRLYVKKKADFDIPARNLLSEIQECLELPKLRNIEIFRRYDVENLTEKEFQNAKTTIFSDPDLDNIANPPDAGRILAVEPLPGQYDQRGDMFAQCLQIASPGERPIVKTARVYVFSGELSDSDFAKIREFLINPVESREAAAEIPETLEMRAPVPEDIEKIDGFINMSDEETAKYHAEAGFAMTVEDLIHCREYFKSESRDPFATELKVIDTYWSDHCRHTTFLTHLNSLRVEDGPYSDSINNAIAEYKEARAEVYGDRDKPVTLMDIATMGMRLLKKRGQLEDLDESKEINACSIEVPVTVDGKEESWLIQFKNETHNHPTEIEPFGGAQTCLGGAIRDPLSGRAYVYQAMRVTGSGDPTGLYKDRRPGKLWQKSITRTAARGYASYGNQIGAASGQITEIYDEGFVAKRMEMGALVGASPKSSVVRGEPAEGDYIVLLGGRTGRDGCGGATGSSRAHDSESIEGCGAEVQKGNPAIERKIVRLFRDPKASTMIKRCNDFGAGGVSVAIGELADSLTVDLDLVPPKYEGLSGTELAISESQERMAVVLSAENVDKFIEMAHAESLEATKVARVTNTGRLRMTWRGKTIVDLSREFLNTNGVTSYADAYITSPEKDADYRTGIPAELAEKPLAQAFKDNLSRLSVASQKGLTGYFDASAGASTVLMPLSGKYQNTPENAMSAKIPLEKGETDDATVMSFGYLPGAMRWSPFHGAAFAVLESLAKLAATGADSSKARLSFQEYFERLGGSAERWGKPAAALLGAFTAEKAMNAPSIGGKDSMSGTFDELKVPPTLVSFAITMGKASDLQSAEFKNIGSRIVFLPIPFDKTTLLPEYDKVRILFSKVYELVKEKTIFAAKTVRDGGAAAAAAQMAFGNMLGIELECADPEILFTPQNGSFVIEIADLEKLKGLEYTVIGKVTGGSEIIVGGEKISLTDALKIWNSTLENVFPQDPGVEIPAAPVAEYTGRSAAAPAVKTAVPRVIIPVVPGTNTEYDAAKAFTEAGAEVRVQIIDNLTPERIAESLKRLAEMIKDSQILMLPGGYAGAFEPDGSDKFLSAVLNSPAVAEAVKLLDENKGLILGFGNAFKALLNTGLLLGKNSGATLAENTLDRHVSAAAYTKITSVKSPWLAGVNTGDLHTVMVSGGESRFVCGEELFNQLSANGQIVSVFTDTDGNPSVSIESNPTGSGFAVEGIVSPDGRIFGKIAYADRFARDCYKNIPGEKDQKIFESGVKYFK